MKSSFKYVIVLVILSLSGLFIYQLFWITGLYHSRQKQNQEEIRMAIKNADHIELFDRADFLSRVTHRQRETSAIADTKGGAALSTRFPDKDSVIPELSVQPLDTNIYHPRYRSQTLRNEADKMLKSTAVEVGNDFRSLGELGLQMQQALHEVIDSVKHPVLPPAKEGAGYSPSYRNVESERQFDHRLIRSGRPGQDRIRPTQMGIHDLS